jgi:uncharacterized phage infection (PIP) family protein YhgE
MKTILYIVAIVAILAGAWFSYDSMNKFATLRTQREELDGKNENRKASIKTAKKEEKEKRHRIAEAKARVSDAKAGLDNAQSKLNLTKTEASKIKGQMAALQNKLDESEKAITEVKKVFKDVSPDVSLDELPALVQKLEDDLKESNKKLEEAKTLTEAADARVAKNDEQIQDLDRRIIKRATRIKGNASQGRITAVNHDWGFVTVEVPSNMHITTSTKLLIKRGMNYIGNLKINSIEGRRVVCDIDYRSMTPGMVVQPGDHVIPAKPVTN